MPRKSLFTGASGSFVFGFRPEGLETVNRNLRRIPLSVKVATESQLWEQAERLVERMRAIVRIDTGKTRESIHTAPGRFDLSVRVIADPLDEEGKSYAEHEEYGHVTKEGVHVPARPFFWPTWRVMKKGIRRAIVAAVNKAIKAALAGGWNSGE